MDLTLTLFLLCPFVISTTMSSEGCPRPDLPANVDMDGFQKLYNPGDELVLSCIQGHTPQFSPRTIVCSERGVWTTTRLICIPKRCPYPDMLANGELQYEDTTFKNIINYTCHEGHILTGASTAVCQANGTWSSPVPECKPVTCGLAPIPEFGMIIYDKTVRGNSTEYGLTGTYSCRPPYVVNGSARAECTASGSWTKTPECRVVTCPPPENIDRGYMSTDEERDFDFMETVKYGCHGDYALEGSLEIVCQQNGQWSEKPSCKAPCSVDIKRGRILYKGQKHWIEDLQPNRVLHKETVSLYCLNKVRGCGYPIPTQCNDGKLIIPECFEEPGPFNYSTKSGSLPSEIEQC